MIASINSSLIYLYNKANNLSFDYKLSTKAKIIAGIVTVAFTALAIIFHRKKISLRNLVVKIFNKEPLNKKNLNQEKLPLHDEALNKKPENVKLNNQEPVNGNPGDVKLNNQESVNEKPVNQSPSVSQSPSGETAHGEILDSESLKKEELDLLTKKTEKPFQVLPVLPELSPSVEEQLNKIDDDFKTHYGLLDIPSIIFVEHIKNIRNYIMSVTDSWGKISEIKAELTRAEYIFPLLSAMQNSLNRDVLAFNKIYDKIDQSPHLMILSLEAKNKFKNCHVTLNGNFKQLKLHCRHLNNFLKKINNIILQMENVHRLQETDKTSKEAIDAEKKLKSDHRKLLSLLSPLAK